MYGIGGYAAQQLIDAIRIFWELDLLILAFYSFSLLLSTKFCKNRTKLLT